MLGHASIETTLDIEIFYYYLDYPVNFREFGQVVLYVTCCDEFYIALVHQHLWVGFQHLLNRRSCNRVAIALIPDDVQ